MFDSLKELFDWRMTRPVKEYKYFDTPDGEDSLKKLWVATRLMGVTAFGVATADVMLASHPKTYLQTFGRYIYFFVPLLGMSTAFVVVTNLSTNIRGKDDKLNWVLGAVTAGGIFGAWQKSYGYGAIACSLLVAIAAIKKHALQNDYTLIDVNIEKEHGTLRSVRQDWTLTKHRPGNWTTGKE